MVKYEQVTIERRYFCLTPFGAQYLTEVASLKVNPVREWSWEPINKDLEKVIELTGTLGGTTGTGPTAKEDEIRDEM